MLSNERRDNAWHDLAQHLSSGYVLSPDEVRTIFARNHYEVSSLLGLDAKMCRGTFQEVTGVAGAPFVYRHHRLYRDVELLPEETDLDQVMYTIRVVNRHHKLDLKPPIG